MGDEPSEVLEDEFIDDKEIAQEAMDADIALETEEEETSEN